MQRTIDYRHYLKAIGRKPIPPVTKLRTEKKAGDREITPSGEVHIHRGPHA